MLNQMCFKKQYNYNVNSQLQPPRAEKYMYCIAGKLGRYKIWQICLKKLLVVFKFGRFAGQYSVLALFTIVSGTEKCLVALAGPSLVAYFPIFALSAIGIISVGNLE